MSMLDLRSRAARAEHAWMMARRALTAAYGDLTRAEVLGHQHAEAAAGARAAASAVRAAEREVDDCYVALLRAEDALLARSRREVRVVPLRAAA